MALTSIEFDRKVNGSTTDVTVYIQNTWSSNIGAPGGGPYNFYLYESILDGDSYEGNEAYWSALGNPVTLALRSKTLPSGVLSVGVPFTYQLIERNCTGDLNSYVVNSSTSISGTYTIELPGKPVLPIPTDGANQNWNDTFGWSVNPADEDDPLTLFHQVFPPGTRLKKWFEVYMGKTSGSLTRVENLTELTSYALREANPDRFNLSDLQLINPYYGVTVYWRIDAWNQWGETQGDEWSLVLKLLGEPDDLVIHPPVRPDVYDPDFIWVPGEWDGDDYTPPAWGSPGDSVYISTGGGRWQQQLVAIGNNLVYIEDLT
jgi:hypothetical protein